MQYKNLISVALFIISLVAVASFASPYWTVHCLHEAFHNRDAAALNNLIDFPSLRESIKSDFFPSATRHLKEDAARGDHPFLALGLMLGNAVVDTAVDSLITPEGLGSLFNGATPTQAIQNSSTGTETVSTNPDRPKPSYDLSYQSLNTFMVRVHRPTSDRVISFGLERTGIFSWKLNKIWIGD